MAKQEVYQISSADGVSRLHAMKWMPEDDKVVGVLQIVHGMLEYIERYQLFAEFMTSKGFVVVAHDHIGHGDSVATKEEWGLMRGEHPSDIMVEDVISHYKKTKADYPEVPYFILGHSMGSYMFRKALAAKASDLTDLSGAIIMGTGTEADGAIKMGLTLINIVSKLKGKDYKSKFVASLMFGAPYKQFSIYGEEPEKSWLTKDVAIVKKYYQDPKCTYMFSLNAYKGLVEATQYDNNPANVAKMNKETPVLFVSGAMDPVGGLGKGVEAARDKFVAAGMKDVSLKLYENDRHEILNETDKENVFQDIYQWMISKMN